MLRPNNNQFNSIIYVFKQKTVVVRSSLLECLRVVTYTYRIPTIPVNTTYNIGIHYF